MAPIVNKWCNFFKCTLFQAEVTVANYLWNTYCAQVAGSNDKAIRSLMECIFGSDGLTSCTDDVSYDEAVRRLQRDVLPAVPKELQDYVTDKLEPLLKANVIAGLLTSLTWNITICIHIRPINTCYFKSNSTMLTTLIDDFVGCT